jgi:hypothetical protein
MVNYLNFFFLHLNLSHLPLRKGEASIRMGNSLRKGAPAPLTFFPLSCGMPCQERGTQGVRYSVTLITDIPTAVQLS